MTSLCVVVLKNVFVCFVCGLACDAVWFVCLFCLCACVFCCSRCVNVLVGDVLCVVVWFGWCVFVVAVCVCVLVLSKPLFAACVRFIL